MEYFISRLTAMGQDCAAAGLLLAPVFLLLHLSRWHDRRRTVLYLLFAVYLSGVYAAAGLPHMGAVSFRPRLNFTLFAYMFSDYRSSLLNILFFMPLGFLLPLLWSRFRFFPRTVLYAFGASLAIELLQLFTPRATDVNDLLTNTVGAILGYGLSMLIQWIFPGIKSRDDSRDLYLISLVVAAVMFFAHPFLFP